MNLNELVTKTAAERGVTPLAASFGVDLNEAEQVAANVVREGFFDEMARYGFVPRTKEAADQMLSVAARLEEAMANEDADETDNVDSLFKMAAQALDAQLGHSEGQAAHAAQMAERESAAKTAGYLDNPQIAALMLARHDAYTILEGNE